MKSFSNVMYSMQHAPLVPIIFAVGAIAIGLGIFLLVDKIIERSIQETTSDNEDPTEKAENWIGAIAVASVSSFKNAIATGVIIAFVILFIWVAISVFKFEITGHGDFFSAFMQQISATK